jgi:hypothetical protein
MGKYTGIVDKAMERSLVEFASTLHPDMKPAEIIELYDLVEKEHWLAECKVILMRTLFQATLVEQFAKEQKESLGDMSQMFG